jgi:hypothetical protein
MKIIFFNLHHNGDIYPSKEPIRTIVKNNSAHTFSIYVASFTSLFIDIKGLEILDNNIENKDIDNTKEYYIKNNILYINTYVGNRIKESKLIFDKDSNNEYYTRIINEINNLEITPKLIFHNLQMIEFMPSIFDNISMNDVPEQVKLSLKNPCIFLFNMIGNWKKINLDFNLLISDLALKYSTYIIIVAKKTTIKLKNVICISDLNIEDSLDGKNLLIYTYIASFCSIIISSSTGGAMCIFNRYTMTSQVKQYIIMLYNEDMNAHLLDVFKISFVSSLKKYIIQDNKHFIPLNKYAPEDVIVAIDKIGPISPANFTTTGGRLKNSRNRKSKGRSRKNKIMRLRSRNLRCKEKNK